MNSQFNSLIQMIEERTGIMLNERSLEKLLKLLQELCRNRETALVEEQLRQSDFNSETWQAIIQALTVGETYFYRNKNQMAALKNHILPKIIQDRRQRGFKQLRIWSAGCATGEEPYSISMLLHELIPDITSWSITILATDINEAYIAFAKLGVYTQRSFRGETDASIRDKWFKTSDKKSYEVLPKIRQRVIFANLNLKDDSYPSFANHTSNMDIILCRNVTIYFDKPTTNAIINRFYNALNIYGWLLVGHSEPNLETYKQFESYSLEGSVAYFKGEHPPKPLTPVPQERPKTAPLPAKSPLPAAAKPLSPAAPPPSPEKSRWLESAQTAADAGNWGEAMDTLDKAEAENNLDPAVHYLRGLVLLELGQVKDSQAALRQSIYCDADFVLSHCLLGDAYKRDGDLRKAQQHWQTAKDLLLKLAPNSRLPYSNDLRADELLDLVMFRLR